MSLYGGYNLAYQGRFSGGKIEGTVPAYIKKAGDDNFMPVIMMGETFVGCTSLTTAPTIPSSVIYMVSTFAECTSLTTAPSIPNSVTDLTRCFANCTSLTIAPELWKRVTTDTTTYKGTPVGNGCFEGCTSASNINEIPEYWKTFHEKEIIHVIPKKK